MLYIRADIEIGKFLGEGSFGTVHIGRWQMNDVAVKVMKPNSMEVSEFLEEAHFMASVNHPNILSLWGIVKVNGELSLIQSSLCLRKKIIFVLSQSIWMWEVLNLF